jgi:large subunit ribosomal protein L9
MKVILQKDMKKLGNIGDVIKVRDGYGRNYLLPNGIAILADEKNQHILAHQKRIAKTLAAKQMAAAQAVADQLAMNKLEFKRDAGEDDRLFGSVTSRDIADALSEKGIEIDRRKLKMDGPLKELGRKDISVDLGSGVEGTVVVFVSKNN